MGVQQTQKSEVSEAKINLDDPIWYHCIEEAELGRIWQMTRDSDGAFGTEETEVLYVQRQQEGLEEQID